MSSSPQADPRAPRAGWLIRDAEIAGQRADCLVTGGKITAIGPDLRAPSGAVIVAGGGGALLPGLTDHHIHLRAAAAARRSVDMKGGTDLSPLTDLDGAGWVRAVGAGKLLSRTDIDRVLLLSPGPGTAP